MNGQTSLTRLKMFVELIILSKSTGTIQVLNLLKENIEMTPKDIWWALAVREEDLDIVHKWQTTYVQMMNQIKQLVKENKIMLTDNGEYIWIDASDKQQLQKLFLHHPKQCSQLVYPK